MIRCPYLFLDIRTKLATNECKSVFGHTKVFLPPLSLKHTTSYCLSPMITAGSTPYRSTYALSANMLHNSSNDDPRFEKHTKSSLSTSQTFWMYGIVRIYTSEQLDL